MDPHVRQRPRFRWWWAAIPLASLGAAALSAYIIYAATYQPLTSGAGMQVTQPVQQWTWQGLPAGIVQVVNTVGDVHYDLYAPPQRGWFSIEVRIVNNGPFAVAIESVTMPGSGLLLGRVRAFFPFSFPHTQPVLRDIRGLVIQPDGVIYVGIPLRSWACGNTNAWLQIRSFTVTDRALGSTYSVVLPLDQNGGILLVHPPGRPDSQGVICAR